MLTCRALTTFNSKYGLLRAGERVIVDPKYFEDVNRGPRKMLEEIKPNLQPNREPPMRQVHPGAPLKKDQATNQSEPSASPNQSPSSEEPSTAGSGAPSSASRPGRRSRKRT